MLCFGPQGVVQRALGENYMRRREFITLIGGAATWPLAARAQQPAMPVIGFLANGSPEPNASIVKAFRKGLSEAGYVEGQNVTIEYRWAENQADRLPALAAGLIDRHVAVIVTRSDLAAFAAKAATTTIPIVFTSGGDPVRTGLVPSLSQPSGNVTGVSWFSTDLVPKRLGLLHELVPNAAVIALLVDQNQADSVSQLREMQEAARAFGLQLVVSNVRTASDIDTAFAAVLQQRAGALVVGAGNLFTDRREQLIALAAHHAVPAIYSDREAVTKGGLVSYANNQPDALHRAGVYTGRILKGTKPADLPVERATRFELIVNLKTAKALGLTVPQNLLVAADEVIE
jgi:putative ABC transport system substrate-binding protein